nr:hypothetical protein [Saprospiraceae bacterium]
MKNTIIFAGLMAVLLIGFNACQNNPKTGVLKSSTGMVDEVPTLLDRHEKIQYGKEWETVQNAYGKERKALMADPNAKEPWLNLAEIFIQEARVTGEHPHYYPAALVCLEKLLAKQFDPKDVKDTDL